MVSPPHCVTCNCDLSAFGSTDFSLCGFDLRRFQPKAPRPARPAGGLKSVLPTTVTGIPHVFGFDRALLASPAPARIAVLARRPIRVRQQTTCLGNNYYSQRGW